MTRWHKVKTVAVTRARSPSAGIPDDCRCSARRYRHRIAEIERVAGAVSAVPGDHVVPLNV